MVTIKKFIAMHNNLNLMGRHAALTNTVFSPTLNHIPNLDHLNSFARDSLMEQIQNSIYREASFYNTFNSPMLQGMQNISSMLQPALTTSHIASAISRNDSLLNSINNLLANLECELPNFTSYISDIDIDFENIKEEIKEPNKLDLNQVLAILICIIQIALSCMNNISTQKQLQHQHQERMVLEEKQIELQENILEVLYQLQSDQQSSTILD